MFEKALTKLNADIVRCRKCPRLIEYCHRAATEKRSAYKDQPYWGKPVPNFGDPNPRVLIVGLAPAAHGANRTGRMFTGDKSGEVLFEVLHQAGLADRPASMGRKDGLRLNGVMITAVTHCAPPQNKLTLEEQANCKPFLKRTFDMLADRCCVVALGQVAYRACVAEFVERKWCGALEASEGSIRPPRFAHGAEWRCGQRVLLASYHPSQQNVFTGKLTRPMLLEVFLEAREFAKL